jgi:ankyrin repeat protein
MENYAMKIGIYQYNIWSKILKFVFFFVIMTLGRYLAFADSIKLNEFNLPLFITIKSKNVLKVEKLLKKGTNPNTLAYRLKDTGNSIEVVPLLNAIEINSLPISKILLEYKADPNICIENGEIEISVRVYVVHDLTTDITIFRRMNLTPLFYAIWMGRNNIAKLLVDYQADVNAKANCNKEFDRITPVFFAAYKNNIEMMKFLSKTRPI